MKRSSSEIGVVRKKTIKKTAIKLKMTKRQKLNPRKNLIQYLYIIAASICLAFGIMGLTDQGAANPLVAGAEKKADEVAVATISAYISLRAINAALSTAQEIEIGASAIGQASLHPLKVLEPVDDTVERVANALFLVGAGAVVITTGIGPIASIGLIFFGISLYFKIASQKLGRPILASTSTRAARLGLMTGIAFPLVVSLGFSIGSLATESKLETAQAELNRVAEEANWLIGHPVDDSTQQTQANETSSGWFSSVATKWTSAADGVRDVLDSSARYLEAAGLFIDEADSILSASLTLIGVFFLRMIILPLGLLIVLRALLRSSTR